MNKRNEIRKIWTECFDDSPEYVAMYFDRVYRDDDVVALESGGTVVSSLLLQRYSFQFHGRDVAMSYVAGAATRRQFRGHGFMSALMHDAIVESYNRGDMLCALIPAHDWLYFYYDRFGFATVFYVDPQRFTSLHTFSSEDISATETDDHYAPEVYEAFSRMERARICTVLHTHRDFLNILDDLRLDNGRFVVMRNSDFEICSMAWAVERHDIVEVRDIMSLDTPSHQAVLARLRQYYPDKAFKVMMPPDDHVRRHLFSHGMARIINAGACLSTIAAANPRWRSLIRITDNIIADNCHTFLIEDGVCSVDDDTTEKLSFDVDIATFTEIVFSSRHIGDILDFPSVRPIMSLMLD